MLDAPVSGSVPQVQAGTLTIMVGGDEQAYAARALGYERRDLAALFKVLGELAGDPR